MIRVWKSELRKLIRPRFLLSTILVTAGLQAAITATLFLRAQGSTITDLERTSGLFYSTKMIAPFLGMIALCIFAANTAQEYIFGTLKNLLVRQPNRIKLMLGKVIALLTFITFLVLTSTLVGVGLSYLFSSKHHIQTAAWNIFNFEFFLNPLLNVLLSIFAYGLLGVCLAVVLRSSIMAISAGLVWLLVIESLIGLFGKGIAKWMPGGNFASLGDGGSSELSFMHSALVAGIYSAGGLVLVLIIFSRRDVAN